MSISPTVGAMSRYLSRIKLSRTWRGSRRAYDDAVRAHPARRPDGLRVVAAAARRGGRLRPARPPVRGPRHHLRRARWTATTWRDWSGPSGRAYHGHGAAGAAPRAHPQGSRLPARGGRQGQLPRRGAAAHDRASTAHGRRCRRPGRRRDAVGRPAPAAARKKPPNYTAVHGRRAGAHRPRGRRGSWPSPRACPRAPACRRFEAAFPTACTTWASRSSTR